jgi:hypothetical protein
MVIEKVEIRISLSGVVCMFVCEPLSVCVKVSAN